VAQLKLGVIADNLRLPLFEALPAAARMGAEGVQIWCVNNELDPERTTPQLKRQVLDALSENNLRLSALCGDAGRGFTQEDSARWSIDRTKPMLELARELGTTVVTTHIGVISEDRQAPEWKTLQRAMNEIGAFAESLGVFLATETGPEEPRLMREFFETLDTRAIKINYDPANLVMGRFDVVGGVHELRDYIVHTHAKDALIKPDGKPAEVPVGQGQVPWDAYLRALVDIGFDGYLAVEREGGEDRVGDSAAAIRFLRGALARL